MKYLILVLIVVTILFGCGENHKLVVNDNPPDTTVVEHSPFENMTFGQDNTLEVMTWNLKEFPLAGNTTVNKVADALTHLSCDVVALQEIDQNSYFENLVDKLNETDTLNTWAGYRSTGAYMDINIAYLYKTNVVIKDTIYQILQSEHYYLPRSPLVFKFFYHSNQYITIANHYKASGDTESENRRREASVKLYDYIEEHFPNDNVIMLGDLNDELTDPPQDNVFQIFLDDPVHYKFADMSIAQGPSSDWSYPSWPSHLDHILITDELFDEFQNHLSAVKTIKPDDYIGSSEYYSTISDHRPVALKLWIN